MIICEKSAMEELIKAFFVLKIGILILKYTSNLSKTLQYPKLARAKV